MNLHRFRTITRRYASLRIGLLGDFCLDRYLEIDPARAEHSIETNLPVHNVVRVRSQPGGAGTILNNLVALGVGTVFPVGFRGMDGEGYELDRALRACAGVCMDHFLATEERRTFTYCKPLICPPGQAPVELNRLDSKNWMPTPSSVEDALVQSVNALAADLDALLVLDQVDQAETGVVTARLRNTLGCLSASHPRLQVIADSRRGLRDFPPLVFKMNAAELAALTGQPPTHNLDEVRRTAASLARKNGAMVFVTLAEHGMLGALPTGVTEHRPALPVRGEIDIVGAGDAVTANLAAALAADAQLGEALELASTAASIVIHQLGTTGTASVPELARWLSILP